MKTRRVVIIHGFGDDPSRGWINWLVCELESRGIVAVAPAMPSPRRPDLERWLEAVQSVIGSIDEQTALVGHSLGCFLLLRFLERYRGEGRLGKLVLVAGFALPANPEHHQYFAPEPDFGKIKARAHEIYNIHSDNDHVVLPSQTHQLNELLGGELIIDPGKGHFAGPKGVNELPSVLKIVLDNS